MKLIIFLCLSMIYSYIYCSSGFTIGSYSSPISGLSLVSLFDLQNNAAFANAFIDEYNNGGIPCVVTSQIPCCIAVQEGALAYAPIGISEHFNPYSTTGSFECSSSVSVMKFGTDTTFIFFNSINSTFIQNDWTTDPNNCGNGDYALYGPRSSSFSPSPTPLPSGQPINQNTCCLYFSATQQYESTFCQEPGYLCPFINDFSPVGNYTVSSCSSCSIDIP